MKKNICGASMQNKTKQNKLLSEEKKKHAGFRHLKNMEKLRQQWSMVQ